MHNLNLALISFFHPTLGVLEKSGLPVNQLLRDSGLYYFNLEDQNGYVPLDKVGGFLDNVSNELGQNLSIFFAGDIRLVNAGDFGKDVVFSKDLLEAVNYGVNFNQYLLTNSRLMKSIDGAVTTVKTHYFNKPEFGMNEIELLDFILLYDGITLAAGTDWSPLEIKIQGPEIQDFDKLVQKMDGTKILFNQPVTSISFPTHFLTRPMLSADTRKLRIKEIDTPKETLNSRLELLIDSSTNHFNLSTASKVLDVSERTLKRLITEEGKTYKELIDTWRFKKALKLLNEPEKSINEISQRLHYSNPSNFIRAFIRWTGTSPMQYRNHLS